MPITDMHAQAKSYNPVPFTLTPPKVEKIILPLPPSVDKEAAFEMQVYVHFMRHLRQVPNSRMEIKILSAIQFTSDVMNYNDALIAKTLVDLGLRAPRKSFPLSFLDFCDRNAARRSWNVAGHTPVSIAALREHWERIGENMFASSMRTDYSLFDAGVMARA